MAKYFSESEFKCKHCGCLPADGMDKRLLSILDFARSAAGSPIYVSSGYRCPVHNANVGGASESYHMQGMAADVYSDYLSVHELKALIKASMDECNIQGGLQEYVDEEFVHVDVRGYWAEWC